MHTLLLPLPQVGFAGSQYFHRAVFKLSVNLNMSKKPELYILDSGCFAQLDVEDHLQSRCGNIFCKRKVLLV